MLKNLAIAIIILLIDRSLFAQENEKTKELHEVEITVAKLNRYYVDSIHTYFTKREIEQLQPDDLGELLGRLPGVNVKSYGGLGGLKTVSIRGLGGQHTKVIIDGFSQNQTQTGQINFGQIQLDNVESIIVQRGGSSELTIPVIAQLSGNTVLIETFQSKQLTKPLQLKYIAKIGSFGQIDQHFIAKTGNATLYGGGFFKYRKANGKYPFRYTNYQTEIKDTRSNNDYSDFSGGIDLHFQPVTNHKLNLYFHYFEIQQGLPGAVILYNNIAKQRLNSTNIQLKTDYSGKIKNLHYRLYYSTTSDSLLYIDPTYLNQAGELRATYKNKNHDFGVNMAYSLIKKIHFNIGAQEIYSKLYANESMAIIPERFHFLTFLKTTYSGKKITAIAQLGLQNIQETTQNDLARNKTTMMNPYLEFRYNISDRYFILAYYRNSFRPPNFNELYYNNIGNSNLKPEEANQLGLTTSLTIVNKRKFYLGFQIGGYHHQINNMILTVPSKNLFIWSIQNIGKVNVTGGELINSLSWKFAPSWSIQQTANYTYQQSLDMSNSASPSYRNQVAYSPLHTVNASISVAFKELGMRVSYFYCSKRYSLNENIPSNEIAGFNTFDFTLFNRFKLKQSNSIRLQLTLKNFTNESYAFVKNYIMPGRHILFTFVYALD